VVRPVPASFWRHFYLHEKNPGDLARATVSFQEIYDWDFIKVSPASSTWVEGWGAKVKFFESEHSPPEITDYPVKEPVDWEKLSVLPPDAGPFGGQLEALRLIKESLDEPVYFVETVFSPISVAGRLAGGPANLKKFLRESPSRVLRGLETITKSLAGFVRAALEVGTSGIFLTTTLYGTRNVLSDEQYSRFARPFDIEVLEACKDAPFNILHVCMSNNMLKNMLDYPVDAFNWDATAPFNPSLREISALSEKILIGGVDQTGTLLSEDEEALETEIRRAFDATRGRRFILGPGCSISTRTKDRRLQFVKDRASRLR